MIDEPQVFATVEEAIAQAVSESEPGDEIIVHAKTCDVDDDDNGCTCTPYAFVVPTAAEA